MTEPLRPPSTPNPPQPETPVEHPQVEHALPRTEDHETGDRVVAQIEQVFGQLRTETYSSPLPRADELARYGQVLASAPERMLRMAERAQAHTHAIDREALAGEFADRFATHSAHRWGQVLGFLLAMTALIAGSLTGGWYGAIIAALGAGGLAGKYVFGRDHTPKVE